MSAPTASTQASMLRIEFYISQLVKHQAQSVELISEAPVCFRFSPTLERKSATPISHDQILKLVEEIAPPGLIASLTQSGMGQFEHVSGQARFAIDIVAKQPRHWKVSICRAGARPAAPVLDLMPPVAPVASIVEERVVSPVAQAAPAVPVTQVRPVPVAESVTAHETPKFNYVAPAGSEPRLNRYLRHMIELGASDIHMSSQVRPMVRLHGEMQFLGDEPVMTPTELRSILMEITPERNRVEFDECWDTDFAHTIEGLARFRANLFMDRHGIGAVFRQIPFKIMSPEDLGLPKQVLDLCYLSKGLVVVTGPTGSGKSTTLATLVDYINKNRSDHIITIEDPIEFVHQNKKCLVNQREVNTHTQSFKSALRAALREDPDIVLVGEMRDLETIAIAIETAETGHLVFGTLHTTTAPSTIDRIIDQFPTDRQEQIRVMLSESIKGVIAQVLCKKIKGGRAAAYEILVANSAVANLVREGKTYQLFSVMQTGKNLGMQTMNDSLLKLVKSGEVEAKEAYIKSVDKQGLKGLFTQHNINLEMD